MTDLTTPYEPQAIYYPEQDALEFIERDVPVFASPVYCGLDILIDVKTRGVIGWRISDWSKVCPPDFIRLTDGGRGGIAG